MRYVTLFRELPVHVAVLRDNGHVNIRAATVGVGRGVRGLQRFVVGQVTERISIFSFVALQ